MANKAIFLNRDNTLIENIGYINRPDQIRLINDNIEPLCELEKAGYKLIVVSNQDAIANGIISEKTLEEIHKHLKQILAKKNVHLDKIYYCPFHPNGAVKKYRKESDLRKPNPAMLLTAAKEEKLDLGKSWIVGSKSRDIQAGIKAGCKTILIDNPTHTKAIKPGEPKPDFYAINMKEVVNIIKKYQHRPTEPIVISEKNTTEPLEQQNTETEQVKMTTTKDNNEQLLAEILTQLKSMQRYDMFDEFSAMRLMAGIFQVIVWFCLVVSVWFLMSPSKEYNAVLTSLGFAAVFQLMSLTFYLMQKQR